MSRYTTLNVMNSLRDYLQSYAPLGDKLQGHAVYLGWAEGQAVVPPYIVIREADEQFEYLVGESNGGRLGTVTVQLLVVDTGATPDNLGAIVDALIDAFEYQSFPLAHGALVGDIGVEGIRTYPDVVTGYWVAEIRATITVQSL